MLCSSFQSLVLPFSWAPASYPAPMDSIQVQPCCSLFGFFCSLLSFGFHVMGDNQQVGGGRPGVFDLLAASLLAYHGLTLSLHWRFQLLQGGPYSLKDWVTTPLPCAFRLEVVLLIPGSCPHLYPQSCYWILLNTPFEHDLCVLSRLWLIELFNLLSVNVINNNWEFPGGPVRFHCWGPRFNPWSGN